MREEPKKKGREFKSKNDYANAIKNFTIYLKFKPHDAGVLGDRGIAYFMAGDHARALEDLNRSLLKKKDPYVYTFRASAFMELNDYAQALEDANQAIRLDPESEVLFQKRVMIYNHLGRTAEAEADGKTIARIREKRQASIMNYDAEAACAKAMGFLKGGDREKATAEIAGVMKKYPRHPQLLYCRAMIAISESHLHGNGGEFTSGHLQARHDLLSQAVVDLAKVVEAAPDHQQARQKLAESEESLAQCVEVMRKYAKTKEVQE